MMKRQLVALALGVSLAIGAGSAWAGSGDTGAAQTKAMEKYIVRFGETGLLYYEGGVRNLRGTSRSVTGDRKLNVHSEESRAYLSFLREESGDYLSAIQAALGRNIEAVHNYEITFHGVALELSADEAERVRRVPGVTQVDPAGTYELATDAGPTWIGAPTVWNGSSTVSGVANRGENVVIGIIDSGANADHPSFANDASCGFSAGNPKLVSAADCLQANCTGGNPEDTDASGTGHGVHVASTAGGNRLVPPLTVAGVPLRWEISGVAPCAKVRTYKVCPSNSCDGAAIQRAIQQIIIDGVDVANYSISGGTSPWSDADRAFLDAVNADILVAASAGNTNATITNPVGAVNHRGPWVLTVANSTHDRIEGNVVNSSSGGPSNVAYQVSATPYPSNTTQQVAVASQLGNELGCNPGFAAGSMTGRIALISRGTCTFVEKATNAQAAGAVGMILYNNAGGPPPAMPALPIPGVAVSLAAGTQMRDFFIANASATATVVTPAQRVTDPSFGDILNASSLRGPNQSFDVTKPDITGPGTNIYAAIGDIAPAGGQAQFGFLSGTSMSSPHLAGAAALVRSVNPAWTPREVASALQLTASRPGFKSNGLTAWDADDVGNGRADLSRATRAGLVMNETFANFLAANPASGGNVRTLNLPSMRHTTCAGTCTFTRTFRNTRTTPVSYQVGISGAPQGTIITASPSTFSFNGDINATQSVTFTVTVVTPVGIPTSATSGGSFGEILIRATNAPTVPVPDSRLTVVIAGTADPDRGFNGGFEL